MRLCNFRSITTARKMGKAATTTKNPPYSACKTKNTHKQRHFTAGIRQRTDTLGAVLFQWNMGDVRKILTIIGPKKRFISAVVSVTRKNGKTFQARSIIRFILIIFHPSPEACCCWPEPMEADVLGERAIDCFMCGTVVPLDEFWAE